MPRKRTGGPARRDTVAELKAWDDFFDLGWDPFGELPAIGVETDERGVPPEAVARAAWRRLGRRHLDTDDFDPRVPGWAFDTFGPPEDC